ncbi:hypothetical protein PAAG_11941 [Paracoccidioides lutzii Pb01]|uniref:Aminoglycoside phosphotransferase domain-containing protein n=1 Tax=Paracoccidioides lutzii (strain ATCC MYA-826 / Pb01) TaxID=502779 RepID=A0A0A2V1I2_PARBA|nr:hypothetical protein PAAG_11941 [Paracoccidioides lutzii Pb01]KGQ01363.1 hypothetical protein PAAG_11941 [Paracoccidioides lutzii Pb01]
MSWSHSQGIIRLMPLPISVSSSGNKILLLFVLSRRGDTDASSIPRVLREIANVPVPRVSAWSSDSANPVGAEYIIEGKAPGIRRSPTTLAEETTTSWLILVGTQLDLNCLATEPLTRAERRSSEEYARAMGKNEVARIKANARPRINAYVTLKDPVLPKQALSLLSKYLDATPYLGSNDPAAGTSVLWHPDLHLDNVFVDPVMCKIAVVVY